MLVWGNRWYNRSNAFVLITQGGGFFISQEGLSYEIKKPSGQERTTAVGNYVAEATRRRRRIPQAGFFLVSQEKPFKRDSLLLLFPYNEPKKN